MKIYTKTGDDGTTALANGKRVPKDHARVCAYGDVDELNALLGLAVAYVLNKKFKVDLIKIQKDLMSLTSILANPDHHPKKSKVSLSGQDIRFLEKKIDAMENDLSPLTHFILPGGSVLAGLLHVARTVCRRAERLCVTLSHKEPIPPVCVHYLNRLSDYLFVAARWANKINLEEDVVW